jgi:hypothetical protein
MATGTQQNGGVTIWKLPERSKAAGLAIDGGVAPYFSPDGKWLMTEEAVSSRLWEVGTWRMVRQIEGRFRCFSPDGRLAVVLDATKILRLVEIDTGRILARLESPDLNASGMATFSPDGSLLVVVGQDPQCVHIWNLPAIRHRLAEAGLAWAQSPYPDSAPICGRLRMTGYLERLSNVEALCSQGQWETAATALNQFFAAGELVSPFMLWQHALLSLTVNDLAGYRKTLTRMLESLREYDPLNWKPPFPILLSSVAAPIGPAEHPEVIQLILRYDSTVRIRLSSITQTRWAYVLIGLALYRCERFSEAKARIKLGLEREADWEYRSILWIILAMVEARLGQYEDARSWFDRVERWSDDRLGDRPGGIERGVPEGWFWVDALFLHLLRREARSVVAERFVKLPKNVFAEPRPITHE